jgi:hypothetical protein
MRGDDNVLAQNPGGCPRRRRGDVGRRQPTAFKRLLATGITVTAALSASAVVGARPAEAATVNGYAGAGLVITVNTGQKNTSNHTQYVNSMYVSDTAGWICDNADPTEAWAGSVWYGRTTGCPRGVLFTINRWVSSGSGVCGSYYRWQTFPGTFPWDPPRAQRFRFTACITISA